MVIKPGNAGLVKWVWQSGYAGVAQLVELQFSKLNVVSSSLIARSNNCVYMVIILYLVIGPMWLSGRALPW